jgi:3alpha(or 20beta)-hydroxysteroid dehydrogenase
MQRLADKVCIITGGARGMGAATARLFTAEGARVVLTDMLAAEGEALAAELGDAALYCPHDVRDEDQWKTVVAATMDRFGRIDVLVNNAGILKFIALLDMSKDDFQAVIDTNLTGTFLGIKTVAPVMVAQGVGSIVNISSTGGFRATNSAGAYTASKFGVRGLTKTASLELGHLGVRVNSVHPGSINTPMTNPTGRSLEEQAANYVRYPLQRPGQAHEIAHVSLFLASDESSYCCGTEILADGGGLSGQYVHGLPGAPAGF